MTDKATPETQPAAEEPDGILQTIRDEISNALGGLFRAGRADIADDSEPKAPADSGKAQPADVEGQMKSAVAAVLEEDKRKTAQDTEVQALKDEVAALKALVEKAPEQGRPIERLLGWRDDG